MNQQEKKRTGRPRIEDKFPATAVAVLTAKAQGRSIREVSRITGVSRPTVKEILERNPEAFAAGQKAVAAKMLELSDQALDTISQDKLDKSSAYQLAGIAGLSADKSLALLHQAPSAVTINVAVLQRAIDTAEAIRAQIAAAKAAPIIPTADCHTTSPSVSADPDRTEPTPPKPEALR